MQTCSETNLLKFTFLTNGEIILKIICLNVVLMKISVQPVLRMNRAVSARITTAVTKVLIGATVVRHTNCVKHLKQLLPPDFHLSIHVT
jgi:hypothetical protein